jgi:hypothetical protein
MTIRVMGKPASLMNPPRETFDPEIAGSLTGPIEKYCSSSEIFETKRFAEFIKDQECRQHNDKSWGTPRG